MFNRTAPTALALAFVVVAATALAIIGVTAIPVATAPTSPAAHVATCDQPAAGNDVIGGACYLPTEYNGFPTLDTVAYGTDIPRCAADDFNADHVARCYTERTTDGAVLILNQSDNIVATLK